MANMRDRFNTGKKRGDNKEYKRLSYQIQSLWHKEDNLPPSAKTERTAIHAQRLQLNLARQGVPSNDPMDPHYKRLRYCRYADDFVIGLIGSKAEADRTLNEVRAFIQNDLKLTTSVEKTCVVPANEGVTFLGYTLKIASGKRVVKAKRGTKHVLVRSYTDRVHLRTPENRLERFCHSKGYGDYRTFKPTPRMTLQNHSEAEIVSLYNGEIRGLANYYSLAKSVKSDISKLHGLWRGSLLKTLATKRRSTVAKVYASLYQPNGDFILTVNTPQGPKHYPLWHPRDVSRPTNLQRDSDSLPKMGWVYARTELISRLNARECEYCGTANGPFQVHHVKGLKVVEKGKELWERVMKEQRRKTIVLCEPCHIDLHRGTLPSNRYIDTKSRGRAG
jgi:hypothetical protein